MVSEFKFFNKAIVKAGPIPGRTPTNVPARQPANP